MVMVCVRTAVEIGMVCPCLCLQLVVIAADALECAVDTIVAADLGDNDVIDIVVGLFEHILMFRDMCNKQTIVQKGFFGQC